MVVVGRVYNNAAVPALLSNVKVTISSNLTHFKAYDVLARDGYFCFADVKPGTYTLTAVQLDDTGYGIADYGMAQKEITITADENGNSQQGEEVVVSIDSNESVQRQRIDFNLPAA